MIAKSKIKTFNNTRKYIKKNKIRGGGLLPGTDNKAAVDVQSLINTINNGQETGNYITFDTNQIGWSGIFNDNLQALMKTGKLNETKEFKISVVDKEKMSIDSSTKNKVISELNELLDKDLTIENGYLPKDGSSVNNQSNNQTGNNQSGNSPSNKQGNKKSSMLPSMSSIFSKKEKPLDVSELVTNLKSDVDSLSTDISNININIENEDANEICKNLSNNLNCIGNFINSIYKHLNTFILSGDKSIKIDGYKLVVNDKLSLLILSKIIHKKIGDKDWPPKYQKKLYIESLKMKKK